jgi:hypothetical protein
MDLRVGRMRWVKIALVAMEQCVGPTRWNGALEQCVGTMRWHTALECSVGTWRW